MAIAADGSYEPRQDSLDYDRYARSVAAGEGFPDSAYLPSGGPSALRAPGWPFALAVAYVLPGPDLTAGRALAAVLGAVTVLLLYLLVVRIWGRRTALVAAGLAAVYPPLVGLSLELYSESLFVPLLLAATLAVLRFRESAAMCWAALAGVLAGLAALTRGPGVVALLPLALGLWSVRSLASARSLAAPLVAVLCGVLVVAPWTIRNAVEFGRFVPISTSSGFGLAGTYNEPSLEGDGGTGSWRSPVIVPAYNPLFRAAGVDEATLDSTLTDRATGFMADHPGYVAEVSLNNLLRLAYLEGDSVVAYGEEVVQPGIGNRGTPAERAGLAVAVLLAVGGVVAIMRSRRRRDSPATGRMLVMIPKGPLFLWLTPVALVLVAAPVAGLPRYRIPADPYLLILSAIGLLAAVDALRGRLRSLGAPLAAALVALALAGCGGGDGGSAATGTSSTTTPAADAPTKQEYVAKADRICARALVDARRLVQRAFTGSVPAGGPLALTTERLIKPGIAIRERQARELRALTPPAGASEHLDDFLGYFDVIAAVSRLRYEAGRAEDQEAANRYEELLSRLAVEQEDAAKAYGFDDCSKDVIGTAFK